MEKNLYSSILAWTIILLGLIAFVYLFYSISHMFIEQQIEIRTKLKKRSEQRKRKNKGK